MGLDNGGTAATVVNLSQCARSTFSATNFVFVCRLPFPWLSAADAAGQLAALGAEQVRVSRLVGPQGRTVTETVVRFAAGARPGAAELIRQAVDCGGTLAGSGPEATTWSRHGGTTLAVRSLQDLGGSRGVRRRGPEPPTAGGPDGAGGRQGRRPRRPAELVRDDCDGARGTFPHQLSRARRSGASARRRSTTGPWVAWLNDPPQYRQPDLLGGLLPRVQNALQPHRDQGDGPIHRIPSRPEVLDIAARRVQQRLQFRSGLRSPDCGSATSRRTRTHTARRAHGPSAGPSARRRPPGRSRWALASALAARGVRGNDVLGDVADDHVRI